MAGTAAGAAKRAAARAGAATPTDRRPARKATVRKSTVAELEQTPAAQAETLAEDVENAVNDDGSYDLRFGDVTFHVQPPGEWDKSVITALNNADFDGWARAVMDRKNAALFITTPMTMQQANDLAERCGEAYQASGVDPTLQRGRATSSGPTPRRSR